MAKNKSKAVKEPKVSVNELAQKIARMRALSEPVGEALGQKVYQMKEGWETDTLKNDKDIKCVMTCSELEDAIRKPETEAIFVPKKALITNEKLFEIIQRNGLSKTVFIEA